ncbi:putative transporter ESBP6 [Zancudomyces culisetae]|uniref:Putative transporter ESBP6 n=1 Tax=Zancudomyces culisetae TaxID=1213189 RepID=A0A1R1PT53_ZANCU|nr:putative transporter ESBP6 [Zancudomyces culisetae]|eukprot:OMH84083.1 putative transporter ESBP6 [Zancudomyces culisetae]
MAQTQKHNLQDIRKDQKTPDPHYAEYTEKPESPQSSLREVNSEKERRPDVGYAWVVMVFGVISFFFAFSNLMVYGIFETYYLKVMFVNEKAANIAWIGTLSNMLTQSCGILAGPLAHYIGLRNVLLLSGTLGGLGFLLASFSTQIWQLTLTQGVLCGFSSSLIVNLTLLVGSSWFEKKRVSALTIISAGSTIGGLVLVPIVTNCIDRLGIGWVFRIMAITFFFFMILGAFFMRPRVNFELSKHVISLNLLKDPYLILVCLGQAFSNAGYLVPLMYFPASVMDLGLATSSSYYLVMVFCGAVLLSRITIVLANKYIGPMNMVIVSHIIVAILILSLWLPNKSITLHIAFYAIYGLFSSPMYALSPVFISGVYKTKEVGQANGLVLLCTGISTVTSTPLIGYLFDKYGNRTDYTLIIIISACFYLLSAMTLVVLRVYTRRNIPAFKHGPI